MRKARAENSGLLSRGAELLKASLVKGTRLVKAGRPGTEVQVVDERDGLSGS